MNTPSGITESYPPPPQSDYAGDGNGAFASGSAAGGMPSNPNQETPAPTASGFQEKNPRDASPFQFAEPDDFGYEAFPRSPQDLSANGFAPIASQQVFSGGARYQDSSSIKQLELRAIFAVDHEMTKGEIIQRCRSLPGIRQVACVGEQDIQAVDAIMTAIPNFGFGNGPTQVYSGSVPIEFIREGGTLLAVQTDGGFAPGVRETLMLVARELSK